MSDQCYRCFKQLDAGDRTLILVLRLLAGSERNFGQYDYCGACARVIAVAMRLPDSERDALRLRGPLM